MLYTFKYTIPANVPADKPKQYTITLEGWKIKRISVYFPPGCCCLAGVRLKYGVTQIWPEPEKSYAFGHAFLIGSDVNFIIPNGKADLVFEFCNLDMKYSHTLYIYIEYYKTPNEDPQVQYSSLRDAILYLAALWGGVV